MGLVFQWTLREHNALSDDARVYLNSAASLLHGHLPIALNVHFLRAPAYILGVLFPSMPIFEAFPALGGKTAYLNFIRIEQAAFWALQLLLVYQITKNLVNTDGLSRSLKTWLPIISLALGVLYFPLLFHTDRILVETSMTMCLLLSVWCWQKKWYQCAALFVVMTLLHKSGMVIPFLIVFPVTWLIASKWIRLCQSLHPEDHKGLGYESTWLQAVKLSLLWVLCPLLLFFMLCNLLPQTPLDSVYFWQFTSTEGWSSFSRLAETFGNLDVLWVDNVSNSTIHEGIQLLTQDPLMMLAGYFANLGRLFSLVDNPYWQSWFFMTPDALLFLYAFILLGLFWTLPHFYLMPVFLGQVISVDDPALKAIPQRREMARKLLPLLVLYFSWALVFAFTNVEARYMLPVMPVAIVVSAYGWWCYFTTGGRFNAWQRSAYAFIILLLFAFANYQKIPDTFYSVIGSLLTRYLTFIPSVLPGIGLVPILVTILFFLVLIYIVAFPFTFDRAKSTDLEFKKEWRQLSYLKRLRQTAKTFPLCLLVILCLMILSSTYIMDSAVIESQEAIPKHRGLKQEIAVDHIFWQRLGLNQASKSPDTTIEPTATFLALEVYPVLDSGTDRLKLSVNGFTLPEKSYTRSDLPQGMLNQTHLLGGIRSFDSLRQYRVYRIPNHLLEAIRSQNKRLPKAISINLQASQSYRPYHILLDYPAMSFQGNRGVYYLPNPDWGAYSIYRALALRDGRQYVELGLDGAKARLRMALFQIPEKDIADGPFMYGHLRQKPIGKETKSQGKASSSALPVAYKAFYLYF
ncbi:MAG: hypothetical protein VKJ04_11380 [Vampirovibrionales bacterium]|nr:hypothetical protein [Vampirovibrionales bacterium]